MKSRFKLWSILMLALFTLPVLSSCGGDDEDDDAEGIGKGGKITIVFNGHKIQYVNSQLWPRYELGWSPGELFIMNCPFPYDLACYCIYFPRDVYGDLPSSFFKVGYSFEPNTLKFAFSDPTGEWPAHYVSGSATVVANDGKYISVKFNNFRAVSSESDRDMNIKKGVIKFHIKSDYNDDNDDDDD